MELDIIWERGRRGLPLARGALWACALERRSRESRVIRKSVKHGSEGGGWKSACEGNSLAAYPTHVRFDVAGDENLDMVKL